jgi:KipI family sensor histidine kinase inhibitor
MRLLPSGSRGVLVEVGSLAEVLGLHAALRAEPVAGVTEVVPAARTLLLVLDPGRTSPAEVGERVRRVRPRPVEVDRRAAVEVPVVYDGEDLDDVGAHTGWGRGGVVRRHTAGRWVVAFCGFAPGFGYCTDTAGSWDVPRRDSPRTRVPAGAVGLAGEFSGVYPRPSPGGWQLIGRTDLPLLDLDRDPPALLAPGTAVRFVEAGDG